MHRGAGQLSAACTRTYEQARQTIARFAGCRPGDQVVFTRNTTDALNLLAHLVPGDTVVVTFPSEHHANLLPWRRVVRLPLPGSPREALAAAGAELRKHRRALLAVTGASSTLLG